MSIHKNAVQKIIDKTLEYLKIPAVVGYEHKFIEYLHKDFEALGLSVYKDPETNLLCVKGDQGYKTILSAHLDRHGLISIGYGEYAYAAQYVREIKYGQNDRASSRLLNIIHDRFISEQVFAYDPDTLEVLGEGFITACAPSVGERGDAVFQTDGMDDLPSDIPVAYGREARYRGGFLKGQIDNALSLAVTYVLYEDGYQGAAFLTTEEEIGKSWSHIQDFLTEEEIETQKLFILDTSPYTEHQFIRDGQITLRTRDKSAIFNLDLTELMADYCTKMGLPFHFKDQFLLENGADEKGLGSTELGRLVAGTAGQWNGVTLQIPTLAYHTSFETTTDKAIENFYTLMHRLFIDERPAFLFE